MPLAARYGIIGFPMKMVALSTAVGIILYGAIPADADYVLILKNGRQITVHSYREEGAMIKVTALGGEIGISKDQIQTVRKVGPEGTSGLNLGELERLQAGQAEATESQPLASGKPSAPEENRAQEEKEYQQNISDITDRLKTVRDRYSQSIRDTTSAEPSQLVTEAQVSARQDDLVSRFKDAQQNPSAPAPVKLLEPSPFSSLPPTAREVQPAGRSVSPYDSPPVYTEKQQELLELRKQALELEKERDRLIKEMKQKNLGWVNTLE
ncbi:MAG: hypothetical protein ACREQO_22200 [Candidatus Binatia bacterium]